MLKTQVKQSNNFDYIIIGSGIAGLMSALNASKKGYVLLVTKSKLQESNTYYAQGGIATVTDKKDSFKKHIQDTLIAGHNHNNKKVVEFIIKKGPDAIKELEKYEVKFNRTKNNNFDLKLEGGHSEHRIVYYKDEIGKSVEKGLIESVKKHKNIKILENHFVYDLIINKSTKTCLGIIYSSSSSKPVPTETAYGKRVILASGGAGQVYEKTTNPLIATGDGIAMAQRAGCKIEGMEFIQFHPTALNTNATPLFLLSETLRGEGAKLINNKGVHFMEKIHPLADLAPRDIISKSIHKELKKGPVYLDLRGISINTLKTKYPNIYAKLIENKFKPDKEPIPITPAAHYLCGGIKTDIFGQTNIKNLYALGECANSGFHGANRLASNSLLEGAVMSDQVTKKPLPKRIPSLKQKITSKNPILVNNINKDIETSDKNKHEIQALMLKQAGIIRTHRNLQHAQEKMKILLKIVKESAKNHPSIETYETLNLATTASLIIKAGLKRKKSLGCHILEN